MRQHENCITCLLKEMSDSLVLPVCSTEILMQCQVTSRKWVIYLFTVLKCWCNSSHCACKSCITGVQRKANARLSKLVTINFELGSYYNTVLHSLCRGRLVSGTCLEAPHVNVTRDYLIPHGYWRLTCFLKNNTRVCIKGKCYEW